MTQQAAILKMIPTEGIKKDEIKSYAWFPIKGHSMNNDVFEYYIPEGSIVLGKEVKINSPISFPVHTPVLIMGVNNGTPFAVCKIISFVDAAFNHAIQCTSFNPDFDPYWIPLNCITKVYKVEQIKRPGSEETIIVTP